MTKAEQIKILDNKIKANRAQYMFDRKNAEISAKSSGELDKYEYLTVKDLGYKPDSVENTKFEYSPLSKIFTEGLDKEDKEDRAIKNVGLLKSLQDIRDVNKKQVEMFNNLVNRDDKGGKNKNLENPLYYNGDYDFRTYEKDFNKLTSLQSKTDFMKRFKNDINSLINLSFRENRGTEEEAKERKNGRCMTVLLTVELVKMTLQNDYVLSTIWRFRQKH